MTPDSTNDTAGSTRNGRYGLWLAGVFVIALVIRLLHLLQIRDEAFFTLLLGDGQRYDEWAREIAGGAWVGGDVFYQAPLYPYFLGFVYSIFGHGLMTARVVQAIIGAGACVLVADAGRRMFSRHAGIIAGFGLALYAPAIFFDGLIQKSVLDGIFIALMLWQMSRINERPGRSWCWLGLGMILGCLILTRENALLFVPALLVWLFFQFKPEDNKRLAMSGAFVLGLAVILLPVAVRNKAVGGEFALTTSQFGPNFYIGNNPNADGTYQPLREGRGSPRYERLDAALIAEENTGEELSPAEVSRYWTGRALDYITSQPGDWIALVATKFALLGRAVELVDTESLESYADASVPLRLASHVFHFGVLAPLAVLGLIASWPRRREIWGLYLLITVYAAGLLMFYVVARYRYPLVPMLMLPAAAGLAELPAFVRRASAARVVAAGAAVIAMALFANVPNLIPGYANMQQRMRGVMESNLGTELMRRARLDEAVVHLRRAVEADPESSEFLVNLGQALYYNDEKEEARELYDRALEIDPDSALAHNQIGIDRMERGEIDEAIEHYRQALEMDPVNETVHLNLGNALRAQDRIDEAIEQYRQVIRLREDHAQAHDYLGALLIHQGKTEEGMEHLRTSLRLDPEGVDALYDMGVALRDEQRYDEAIEYLKRVLELEPDYFEAHHVLGFIHGSRGEHEKAVEHFEKLLQATPEFAEGQYNLAVALNSIGRATDAHSRAREAVRLQPENPVYRNFLAGMLATHWSDEIRDAEAAIEHAEKAAELTGRQDPNVLDHLAAAYAGAGRFEEAVATAEEAITAAERAGFDGYARDIRTRLEMYRNNQPFILPRP